MRYDSKQQYCERCGAITRGLSIIQIDYGADCVYDGNRLILGVCGKCVDSIYEYIQNVEDITKAIGFCDSLGKGVAD